MDKNLYHLSAAERESAGIEMLPGSLGEAIGVAKHSEIVRKALGEHIFPRYIAIKEKEWEDYRIQVTEYELERYLSIL